MATSNGYIIGIDIGTSAVKALAVDRNGRTATVRKEHEEAESHTLWLETLKKCFRELGDNIDLSAVEAIAIAAQVNTYIFYNSNVDEKDLMVLSWTAGGGERQLQDIKDRYDNDYFIKHISMTHPNAIAYPIPRITYVRQEFGERWDQTEKILQPKDYLYYKLTGVFASDAFTWRGLSNIADAGFHDELLKDNRIPKNYLPELHSPFTAAATLTDEMSNRLLINKPVPAYLGCNDFFAGLVGMGIIGPRQYFDLTGTSEHLGMIGDKLDIDSESISSPFFNGFVKYGVTAASGTSIDWARRNFSSPAPSNDHEPLSRSVFFPPIFLPYLKGERAPIWDSKARGVLFGLDSRDDNQNLLYSVREGVAFSIYHIWKSLQLDTTYSDQGIRTGGALSADDTLNQLKADIFGTGFETPKEKECTALGTAIIAGVGKGWFSDIKEGVDALVQVDRVIQPNSKHGDLLAGRFGIYEKLYPALKKHFHEFDNIRTEHNE